MDRMNFFLRSAWRQSKTAFVFFTFFILATIWCSLSKIEITPFFLWAHYSDRQTPTGKFDRIYVKVNGENLDLPNLSRPTREMIQIPVMYFIQLEEKSYQTSTRNILKKHLKNKCSKSLYSTIEKRLVNDVSDRDVFLNWLKRYIERIFELEVRELEVGNSVLVFRNNRTVEKILEKPAVKQNFK